MGHSELAARAVVATRPAPTGLRVEVMFAPQRKRPPCGDLPAEVRDLSRLVDHADRELAASRSDKSQSGQARDQHRPCGRLGDEGDCDVVDADARVAPAQGNAREVEGRGAVIRKRDRLQRPTRRRRCPGAEVVGPERHGEGIDPVSRPRRDGERQGVGVAARQARQGEFERPGLIAVRVRVVALQKRAEGPVRDRREIPRAAVRLNSRKPVERGAGAETAVPDGLE